MTLKSLGLGFYLFTSVYIRCPKLLLFLIRFQSAYDSVCMYVCMCVCVCVFVQLFAIPWTVAPQAPLSVGFSRQENWSGSPFPSAGDLPNPVTELVSLVSPALAGKFFTTGATWEVP